VIQALLIAAGTLGIVAATASWQVVLLERGAGLDARISRPVTWGMSLATLLLALHVFGLLLPFREAVLATVLGSLAVAGGVAAFRAALLISSVRGALTAGRRRVVVFAAGVVGATLFLWPALAWFDYWDAFDGLPGSRLITTHSGISLEIANGTYPPRLLSLPSEPYIYHWGIDSYFAAASVLSGARIDHVMDGVTLALWLVTLGVAYLVGQALWSARVGAVFAVLLAAHGGFPWLLDGINRLFGLGYAPSSSTVDWLQNRFYYRTPAVIPSDPPLVSDFFQHPWALGTPLLVALIPLIAAFSDGTRGLDRVQNVVQVACLVVLLTALGLAETAAFFLALGAVLLQALLFALRNGWSTSIKLAAAGIGAVVCSMTVNDLAGSTLRGAMSHLPGFGGLAPSVRPNDFLHLVSLWDSDTIAGKIGWDLASFGFLLVGFAVLLRRDCRSTAWGSFTLAIAVLGLVISNVFYYQGSWNIAKFATPAQIALALGLATTFQRDVEPSTYWNRHPLTRLVVAGGVCCAGVLFQASLFLPDATAHVTPAIGSKQGFLSAVSPDELRTIDWLRGRVSTGQSVVCGVELDTDCAALGGLPQLQMNPADAIEVFRPQAYAELYRLQHAEAVSSSEAQAYGVCWLIKSAARTIPYPGIVGLAAKSPVVFAAGDVLVFRLC
jgi:hypothetical protein